MTFDNIKTTNSVSHDDNRILSNPVTIDESHQAYVSFVSSLKSLITRKAYVVRLKSYLRDPKISFSTFDELLNRDARVINQGIIDILIEMRYTLKMSYSAQNMLLCALTHFFSINEKTIKRKKIAKFMSDAENKYEYRSYTTDEISSLLSISDEREKMIILLLSSTGIRVGALHKLRLKDLKKWVIKERNQHAYQIQVYASSSRDKYFTFCTPECAKAIDNYLDLRRRYGENLIQSDLGWSPSNSYLLVRAFNRRSEFHTPLPVIHRSTITSNIIVPKLEALNLRNRTFVKGYNKIDANTNNMEMLHPCHSFRTFAITQMSRARIDKTIREMLVGHTTGLDAVYYKPSEEEIFEEYCKCIEYVSIHPEGKSNKNMEQRMDRFTDREYLEKKLLEKDTAIQMLSQKQENFEQLIQGLIDSGQLKPIVH